MEVLGAVIILAVLWYFWSNRSQAPVPTRKQDERLEEMYSSRPWELIKEIKDSDVIVNRWTIDFSNMTIDCFFLIEIQGHDLTHELHRTFDGDWFWRYKEGYEFEYNDQKTIMPRQLGREEFDWLLDPDEIEGSGITESEVEELLVKAEKASLCWSPLPRKLHKTFENVHDW